MDDRTADIERIRLLVARYSLAVDSRDLDLLASLYVGDVDTETPNELIPEPLGRGRAAMREYFDQALRGFYRSMHFVGTHVIDFVADDLATGTVYAVAHEERLEPHHWTVMHFTYTDRYELRGDQWLFGARRQIRSWFTDRVGHPDVPVERDTERGRAPFHPFDWPTWDRFWDGATE